MTQARIKALQPPESGQPVVYDKQIPNLGIRLSPGGAKTFIVYRKINGRPRRITLGRFPTLTVEEARRQAQKAMGKIADGVDPVKDKHQEKAIRVQFGEETGDAH